MEAIANGTIAYVANVTTVFALYPYRDFVKHYTYGQRCSFTYLSDFATSRYKGMLMNPSQPLLLALPHGGLYFGYVLGSGGVMGAVLGGLLFGAAKMFNATLAYRLGGGHGQRYDRIKSHSVFENVLRGTRHYGIYSFFCGATVSCVTAMVWFGSSLAVLQNRPSSSFGQNAWNAFATNAFLTFVTAPVRNTFRSALARRDRPGGVKTLQGFLRGEAAVLQEGSAVFFTMLKEDGPRFLFAGTLRTTLKTSVPFALTFALFRSFGGSLGPSTTGGRGGHGPRGARHLMRHY